ncbi:MAG: 50S ribosomal protein L44e [Candidatus Aenigmarchaeota archaeon]|nr:50S ribosomal protein L44e [Candidatus Aenigmarchaeota archaeon]
MKFPKVINTYCPHCRTHGEHAVKLVKKKARGTARPNAQSIHRFDRKMKGYGSFPKPKVKGEGKATKKLDIRLVCSSCKKSHMKKGFRVKKFELS